jgi:hypothetical protein
MTTDPLAFGLLNFDPEAALIEEARSLRRRLRETLGEARAREVWAEVGKPSRGRIPNKRKIDAAKLLAVFDKIAKLPETDGWKRETIARKLAEFAHENEPGKYGASVEAITKTITRALRARDKSDAELRARLAAARLPGLWRLGAAPLSEPPRGLLAGLLMEPDKKEG